MEKLNFKIQAEEGIDSVKAGALIKELLGYSSLIRIRKDNKVADARIIFNVLGLAAEEGDWTEWILEGENEAEEARKLEDYLEANL